jgi:hypothetical protein
MQLNAGSALRISELIVRLRVTNEFCVIRSKSGEARVRLAANAGW